MEENQSLPENKKKGTNKLLILLLTVSVIIIALLVFYIYTNVLVNDKPDTKNSSEASVSEDVGEKELALDDSSFINIYNKIKDYSYKSVRLDNQHFSGTEYLNLIADSLKDSDFTKNEDSSYSLSGAKVEGLLKDYFGSDFKLDKNSVVSYFCIVKNITFPEGSGMQIDSYDSTNDLYRVMFGGVGGTSAPSPKIINQVITKATKSKDEIIVEAKAIYLKSYESSTPQKTEFVYTVFGDVNCTNQLDYFNYDEQEVSSKTIDVNNYLDKASTITYKFKLDKDTNKYYFVSSDIK